MRKLKYLILFFSLISFYNPAISQDKSSGTGPKEQSIKSKRKIRKIQRKESAEKRRKEKAERKAIKAHHKRIQTKKVRKRMKKSKNRATLNNDNRREFFLVRWFKKKKKT